MTGSNSAWLCSGSLLVGDDHFNRLLVEDGGQFACTSAVVGWGMSNEIVVTGTGSSWSNSGDLVISSGSYGDYCGFTVSSGAFARSQSAILAQGRGSSSYAIVTSPGSVWSNAGSLWIGQTGRYNRLTVENGARLFSGSASIGVATASVGNVVAVMGAGSSWSNVGALVVGQGSSSNSLVISGGARVDAGSVLVGSLGTALNCSIELQTGTLAAAAGLVMNTNSLLFGVGTVTVSSASFDNYGIVSPGLSPGRLRVNAAFVQRTGSTLNLDIAGTNTGSGYDQLSVSGSFTYGGTFAVVRARGFVPKVGDAFVLVTYASQIGSSFDSYNLPPWFGWQISSESTRIVLSVNSLHLATNGVPKAWLADNGWTNNFDAAATNDADGDHVATWEEYYAGTDPTNSSSFFQCLEISRTNFPTLGKIIRWNAVSGRVYAIEASTNLATGWQELTNHLAAPINSWTDTVASESRQYRLRAGP